MTGGETGTIGYNYLSSSTQQCQWPQYGGAVTTTVNQIVWTDPGGAVHPFSARSNQVNSTCPYQNTPPSTTISGGQATDGSGYSIPGPDANGNPIVRDNNGNQVYPTIIDRYGNYLSKDGSGNLMDTTGRVPVIATQNGNVTTYDVLAPNGTINNQGTRVRYTVTTTSITVNTDFVPWQNSDIHQWSGTLNPVQSIVLPDGSQYSFTYNDVDGELTGITLPSGGTVSYGYSNFFDSSTTENRLLTSRTMGSGTATTYTPNVVAYCSNYSNGCRERVTMHKPSGDETLYELTLNNGAWNTGVSVYTGSAANGQQLLQTTSADTYTNPCQGTAGCYGANYVSLSTDTKTVYGSQTVSSQTQTALNPSVGKVSAVKEWDYGASFTGTSTRETDYTYTGLDVQQVTVLSNGTQADQTNYGYTTSATATSGVAQHGSQNAGGPYLQTVSHVLTGGNPSVTTSGMDDTGQVVSTSDPNGNPAATISYQCANSLPYQTKNPLGQTTQYAYDCNSGAVTGVKDPNDLANNRAGTTYAYESGAGRPQSVTSPDGGQTSYAYPSTTEVDTTVLATPSPSISSQDFLDSFGRKYRHVQAGVSSETTYDANGRAYCATNPHTSSAASTDGSTCVTASDGLDRPLTQQQPDGTTLGWGYNGATATSTDEAGKQWQRTSDSFGHLVKVVEPGNYATTYSYDGLGNLARIDQWGGAVGSAGEVVRTFVHDSLSRMTNECHPEGIAAGQTCSASGPRSTSYTYYPAGNVKTQTDARGVTATLGYDTLNRLNQKSYSDGTPGQSFGYDQTSFWMGTQYNTIGRLSEALTDADMRVSTAACANQQHDPNNLTNVNAVSGNPTRCERSDELYSYDAAGRLNRIGTAPPSEAGWAAHETDVSYDLAGDMTSLRYPDGRTVTQSWDGSAHLQTVAYDNWNGQHVGFNYAYGLTYTPAGAQTEIRMGNGVYGHMPYNNRQQVCQTWVSGQGGFMDRHYFYGTGGGLCANNGANNGTVSQIQDMIDNNQSQGFSYDGLNRLYSVSNGSGSMQQTYATDSFGNLKQSGTLSFQAGTNGKTSSTRAASATTTRATSRAPISAPGRPATSSTGPAGCSASTAGPAITPTPPAGTGCARTRGATSPNIST